MNIASNIALALVCTGAVIATALASPPPEKGALATAPYAGQQARAITSLSSEDVDDLLSGRGWGLAKPAELNGYPGPLHVLELAGELDLSAEQKQTIQASYDRMKAKAEALGARYVAAERALDEAFRSGRAASDLVQRLKDAEHLRVELRLTHLLAHLEVAPLLSAEQRQRYAALRGYAAPVTGEPAGSHAHEHPRKH